MKFLTGNSREADDFCKIGTRERGDSGFWQNKSDRKDKASLPQKRSLFIKEVIIRNIIDESIEPELLWIRLEFWGSPVGLDV